MRRALARVSSSEPSSAYAKQRSQASFFEPASRVRERADPGGDTEFCEWLVEQIVR
jgi:hypothetical protein